MALYVGSLLSNKERKEHHVEPPIVTDRIITPETNFCFIDIIPQMTNSSFSFSQSNRTNISYHKFSDLINRANLWFESNGNQFEIVNCETVLLFFKTNDSGVVSLARENSCFTLDRESQCALMALRLWIRRSSFFKLDQDGNKIKQQQNQLSNHYISPNSRRSSNTSHISNNEYHQYNHRHNHTIDQANDKACIQINKLKYRDFIPVNQLPNGDHSNFENLDQVLDKLNLAILNEEILAENIITVESLNFPCNGDWQIDNKLELTLHTFPSDYIVILRVFYLENAGKSPGESAGESLTSKLKKLDYGFQIKIKDFIPKLLSRGTFFSKPEFQNLTTCIKRAAKFIQNESKQHQSTYQNLLRQTNVRRKGNFLFDFKNAQCIEVKTKIQKNKVESKSMAHIADGDYIRIFRVAYMHVINLNDDNIKLDDANEFKENNLSLSNSKSNLLQSNKLNSIKKFKLINKSRLLMKSKQLNRTIIKYQEASVDANFDLDEQDDNSIHLSSIIFTPTSATTTISEMNRKIANWTLTKCRDDNQDVDEFVKYSRKPRLLSAETVEVFSTSFNKEGIKSEIENVLKFNRIGTLNNYLYFSFRIYLDMGDDNELSFVDQNLNLSNNLTNLEKPNDDALRKDKCTLL